MRAALVLAAVALFATPAAAESFDSFKSLCLDADSDPAATERAARAMGWVDAPEELVSGFASEGPKVVGFASPSAAESMAAEGEFVMVSRGVITDPAGRQVDVFTCLVGAHSSFSDTQPRIEAWLGAGGVGEEGSLSWAYSLNDGVPESVAEVVGQGEDALAEFAKRKPVHLLGLTDEGEGRVGLFLGVMRTPL